LSRCFRPRAGVARKVAQSRHAVKTRKHTKEQSISGARPRPPAPEIPENWPRSSRTTTLPASRLVVRWREGTQVWDAFFCLVVHCRGQRRSPGSWSETGRLRARARPPEPGVRTNHPAPDPIIKGSASFRPRTGERGHKCGMAFFVWWFTPANINGRPVVASHPPRNGLA